MNSNNIENEINILIEKIKISDENKLIKYICLSQFKTTLNIIENIKRVYITNNKSNEQKSIDEMIKENINNLRNIDIPQYYDKDSFIELDEEPMLDDEDEIEIPREAN